MQILQPPRYNSNRTKERSSAEVCTRDWVQFHPCTRPLKAPFSPSVESVNNYCVADDSMHRHLSLINPCCWASMPPCSPDHGLLRVRHKVVDLSDNPMAKRQALITLSHVPGAGKSQLLIEDGQLDS
jgi:hypothetical protein